MRTVPIWLPIPAHDSDFAAARCRCTPYRYGNLNSDGDAAGPRGRMVTGVRPHLDLLAAALGATLPLSWRSAGAGRHFLGPGVIAEAQNADLDPRLNDDRHCAGRSRQAIRAVPAALCRW